LHRHGSSGLNAGSSGGLSRQGSGVSSGGGSRGGAAAAAAAAAAAEDGGYVGLNM
jgi:hypothetical protein